VLMIGRGKRWVLLGLMAFLLAHLAYLAAAAPLVDLGRVPPLGLGLALGGCLVAAGLTTRAALPNLGRLLAPAVVYTLVLTAMTVVALSAWLSEPGHPGRVLLALGAGLFFVSDIAVARQRFVAPSLRTRLWGLPAYYAAQVLFAFASVGLPTTLGFIGEDLLVHGVLETFAWIGTGVVLVTALNGVTAYRLFARLFLGLDHDRLSELRLCRYARARPGLTQNGATRERISRRGGTTQNVETRGMTARSRKTEDAPIVSWDAASWLHRSAREVFRDEVLPVLQGAAVLFTILASVALVLDRLEE